MNNTYKYSCPLLSSCSVEQQQETGRRKKKYEVRVLVPVFHAFKPIYSNNILVLLAPGTILSRWFPSSQHLCPYEYVTFLLTNKIVKLETNKRKSQDVRNEGNTNLGSKQGTESVLVDGGIKLM